MSIVFDDQRKVLLKEANTPDYIGLTSRYAIDPDLPAGVPFKYIKLIPGKINFKEKQIDTGLAMEMTPAEKAAVDASDFPAVKTDLEATLTNDLQNYLYAHYSAALQAWMNSLKLQTIDNKLPNRGAKIGEAINWIESVLAYSTTIMTQINAATTMADLKGITWTLTPFDATDPAVTLNQVFQIKD